MNPVIQHGRREPCDIGDAIAVEITYRIERRQGRRDRRPGAKVTAGRQRVAPGRRRIVEQQQVCSSVAVNVGAIGPIAVRVRRAG